MLFDGHILRRQRSRALPALLRAQLKGVPWTTPNPSYCFQMVDAVQFYVPDIEAGVRYYGDLLGHEIIRKTESAVGLRMSDSEAKIVIQNERDYQ